MCASFLCLLFLLFSSFELAAEESAEQLLDFHSKPEVFVPLNLEAMSCHILTVLSKAAVMSENFIIPVWLLHEVERLEVTVFHHHRRGLKLEYKSTAPSRWAQKVLEWQALRTVPLSVTAEQNTAAHSQQT